MITFNVGPSKIYPEVRQFLTDAYDNHILSISHRSKEFDVFSEKCLQLLHDKLNIPSDYTILYTGSATESWEIISQDIVTNKAVHFFNGEFGKKWYEYAKFINPRTVGYKYDEKEVINLSNDEISSDTEMLAFTLNETSTGTKVDKNVINEAKNAFPNALIAIDTTSCIGGVAIDFAIYDVIYGSVQKCFGLPAGLGLLIVSPKAIEKAKQKNVIGRYNSLLTMLEQIKKFQTNYTPNVLNIYLLYRILEIRQANIEIDTLVRKRSNEWYNFIPTLQGFHLYITNKNVQSDTVITVGASAENIIKIKKEAKLAGIELGSGYGSLKDTTFRIANFPSITETEIETLKTFLSNI